MTITLDTEMKDVYIDPVEAIFGYRTTDELIIEGLGIYNDSLYFEVELSETEKNELKERINSHFYNFWKTNNSFTPKECTYKIDSGDILTLSSEDKEATGKAAHILHPYNEKMKYLEIGEYMIGTNGHMLYKRKMDFLQDIKVYLSSEMASMIGYGGEIVSQEADFAWIKGMDGKEYWSEASRIEEFINYKRILDVDVSYSKTPIFTSVEDVGDSILDLVSFQHGDNKLFVKSWQIEYAAHLLGKIQESAVTNGMLHLKNERGDIVIIVVQDEI